MIYEVTPAIRGVQDILEIVMALGLCRDHSPREAEAVVEEKVQVFEDHCCLLEELWKAPSDIGRQA